MGIHVIWLKPCLAYVEFLKRNGVRFNSNHDLFVFDIGDEDSLNTAVNRVLWSIDHPSFLGIVPEDGDPYGLILHNRGSEG
jgi:hypothetical protein